MLKKEQTEKRENKHFDASEASGIQPRYSFQIERYLLDIKIKS